MALLAAVEVYYLHRVSTSRVFRGRELAVKPL